ncbi:MAG: glycosyltransferase family 2 protein [Desulfuromonadales bacterium]|nr:glycosyltransferase family 2 protein [Desulfuromonadales bacterium]
MEILFILSILLIVHAYFGYPLSLWVISQYRSHQVKRADYLPPLTLIITACNEEQRIREKLENTLLLDYPQDLLQVIVASDGSTDETNAIVGEYADHGFELLALTERKGKENAQKEAVLLARGEVIVFSDVATRIEPHGLRAIAANFADVTVGCVSSVDKVLGKDGQPCGEGAYVRYEMWLRSLEAKVTSLVGLSGSFFAARKEVCQDFSGDMQSDFRTVLNSMKLGLRGVDDPEAIGFYPDVADNKKEFNRKVRTVLRGQTVFFRNLEFLNVVRYGLFAYQYFCHKLLRWLVPFFLITALMANLLLAFGSGFYLLVLVLHLTFYGLASYGFFMPAAAERTVVKIPLYFLTVNAAILVAWWRYFTGDRMVMWTPSQR